MRHALAVAVLTFLDTGMRMEDGPVVTSGSNPSDTSPGWAAPVTAALLGWAAVPLMFVSPMSFVLALCAATAAGFVAVVVFTDSVGDWNRKLVASLGLVGATTAVCLMVLPFILQD